MKLNYIYDDVFFTDHGLVLPDVGRNGCADDLDALHWARYFARLAAKLPWVLPWAPRPGEWHCKFTVGIGWEANVYGARSTPDCQSRYILSLVP